MDSKYTLPRGYLSASAIECLLQCPKKYEFRYIKNRKTPSNKVLSIGSITHEAFANYYQDILDTTERFTGKELVELTMDTTLPDWFANNEVDVSEAERRDVERIVPDVVENYVDNVGCFVAPLHVEQEVRVTTKSGVDLLAYIDLVRLKNDVSSIVDYKISGRPWSISRLQESPQFMLYTYVTGLPDVQIHNVVTAGKNIRMNKSYGELDPTSSGAYEFSSGNDMHVVGNRFDSSIGDYVEDMVTSCAELVTAGIFPPCLPSSWWCSAKWCDFWRECRGKYCGSRS